MINWREALPGFWLPATFVWTEQEWPDYTAPDFERALTDTPDVSDIIKLRGFGQPSPRAWAAWMTAFNADKPLRRGWADLEAIAGRMYETARYKYLVPAWRRAIVETLTELDDLEDQLSTILWVAETVSRKWIPLPKGLLSKADQARRTLDCAEKVLAGATIFRGGKSDYANCLRETENAKKRARAQKAGLVAWFRENWGRLLEAAQATGQWFDVGIVLGPIWAFIEEGAWGLAKRTTDNYLIAVDALMPGYKEDFYRNAEELSNRISQAWDDTWGAVDFQELANIEEDFPGFAAP